MSPIGLKRKKKKKKNLRRGEELPFDSTIDTNPRAGVVHSGPERLEMEFL